MLHNKSFNLISNLLTASRCFYYIQSNVLYHKYLTTNVNFLCIGSNKHNRRYFQRFYSNHITASLKNICVGDILKKWSASFAENAISEPKESIQLIVCQQLHIKRISDVYNKNWMEYKLSQQDLDKINLMCQKRLQSVPVQYILEEWTFRDLSLKMKSPVFIPRPETEELVEIVKNDILITGVKNVLEICCGSGAICLSLLKELPNISILAIDKSKEACNLTVENAEINNISNRLTVIQHEIKSRQEIVGIFLEKENYFDVIVSNPPYVPTKDMKNLQPEIKLFEDLAALDGGPDGMDTIKPILRLSSFILRPGGRLYLEVDPSHPDIIRKLLHSEKSTVLLKNELTEKCKQNKIKSEELCEYLKLGLILTTVYKDFNQKCRFVEITKIK